MTVEYAPRGLIGVLTPQAEHDRRAGILGDAAARRRA